MGLVSSKHKQQTQAERQVACVALTRQNWEDELGHECTSRITDKEIGKLLKAGYRTVPLLRAALQDGQLHRIGLGAACIAALQKYFEENFEVWVTASTPESQFRVKCIDGRINAQQLASALHLVCDTMSIADDPDMEIVNDFNFHRTISRARHQALKVRRVSCGTEIRPIRINGTTLLTYLLPVDEWLGQPITCPTMTNCTAPPVNKSEPKPHIGWMFDGIETWHDFQPGMEQMLVDIKARIADDPDFKYRPPLDPLDEQRSPLSSLQTRLAWNVLDHINAIALALGLGVLFKEQSRNRSASFADFLLLQSGDTDMTAISRLVLGVGNVSMTLPHDQKLETAWQDPNWHDVLQREIQQGFADAMLDEASLMMFTDGVVIFFLTRALDDNILRSSPPVYLDGRTNSKPLAALLYFAWYATANKDIKCSLSAQGSRAAPTYNRASIAASQSSNQPQTSSKYDILHQDLQAATESMQTGTPPGSGSPARSRYEGEASSHPGTEMLPFQHVTIMQELKQRLKVPKNSGGPNVPPLLELSLQQLGYCGKCLGGGTCTRVFQGEYDDKPAALKVFDARDSTAVASFVHEASAYFTLWDLQGISIPKCLAIGVLCETGALVLVLQLAEAVKDITENIKKSALTALDKLHAAGACHGDVHEGNLLLYGGMVWLADLERCQLKASKEAKKNDVKELDECPVVEASSGYEAAGSL